MSILQKAWEFGHVSGITIKNSKYYDEDFSGLSNYITKDENTQEFKKRWHASQTQNQRSEL